MSFLIILALIDFKPAVAACEPSNVTTQVIVAQPSTSEIILRRRLLRMLTGNNSQMAIAAKNLGKSHLSVM